jgi:hypothetical protein
VLSGGADEDTHQWAQAVLMALHNLDPQQLSMELKPVLDLASEYLTHLLIAGLSCIIKLTCCLMHRITTVQNPGGKRTPQESVCPTPDKVQPLAHIMALINEAVIERTQAALKTLVRHYLPVDGDGLKMDDHRYMRVMDINVVLPIIPSIHELLSSNHGVPIFSHFLYMERFALAPCDRLPVSNLTSSLP